MHCFLCQKRIISIDITKRSLTIVLDTLIIMRIINIFRGFGILNPIKIWESSDYCMFAIGMLLEAAIHSVGSAKGSIKAEFETDSQLQIIIRE
jgi:hypothetical protein